MHKRKPRFVVLGTMASISARVIEGREKPQNPFYYHSPRNLFWRILQVIFEDASQPTHLEVEDRKRLLNRWGIAMANIVYEIKVPNSEIDDVSDDAIFRAHKKNRVKFKRISADFKHALEKKPVFFTCSRKPKLVALLKDYFEHNGLDPELADKIQYLPSPTRQAVKTRSDQWQVIMKNCGVL